MKHYSDSQDFLRAEKLTSPELLVTWGEYQRVTDAAPHSTDPQLGWVLLRALEGEGWRWGQSLDGVEIHIFRNETICMGSA